MLDSKYLRFELVEEKEKTTIWAVVSKMHGDRLGIIKWFGRWRQYAFFPESETVYNNECLNTIASFLTELMAQRKEDWTSQKGGNDEQPRRNG